jgi:hypothetical protein
LQCVYGGSLGFELDGKHVVQYSVILKFFCLALTNPSIYDDYVYRSMNWRNQMACVLLAVAILNPLCCCLGDVLASVFSGIESPGSCCGQAKASEYPQDEQEEPCDCEKQVSAHKETWSDDRLLPSVVVTIHSLMYLACGLDPASLVSNSVQEARFFGLLPSWKYHCVRLL